MRGVAPREFRLRIYDLSSGLVSNLSDERIGLEPRYLKRSDNWLFTQPRAIDVRGGSRALSSATLATPPHSLGKYRPTSGSRALMVGHGTGVSLATAGAYTAQTMPGAAVFAVKPLRFEQLNDVLWVTEHLGANKPFGYIGSGWVAVELPLVAPTPSIGIGAAGLVDIGVHHYRVRHVFVNGSSLATYIGNVNPGVASIINVGNPPGPNGLPTAAPGGRADWLFWSLERTKANDPLGQNGVWYFVKSGTTATLADNVADASLFDVVKDGWYTAPVIFNGTIAHSDRMFGWKDSLLYPSWAIGQKPFLGIFNFDPLNAYRIGSDDGDIILTTVRQAGRLVIFKARSHHFLEGRDLSSFSVSDAEGGISGPRAACVVGGDKVIFYNDAGLHIMPRSTPTGFGWDEVGHYLSQVNPAARDKVVLRAIGTRFLFMAYPSGLSSDNTDVLLHDFVTRLWSHHTGIDAADMLYQQDADFGSARAIVADPTDRDPGGGVAYQLYAILDGVYDRRLSDNTGGTPVTAIGETPLLDLGSPDEWKEITRIEGTVDSDGGTVTIGIQSPDTTASAAANITALGEGDNWAPASGSGSDDLLWDVGDWNGSGEETSEPAGIPRGLLCKRFKVTISSTPDSSATFRGATVDGKLRPERRMV